MTAQTFQSWETWEEAKRNLAPCISADWLTELDGCFRFALSFHQMDRRANGDLMETHLVQVLQVVIEGLGDYDLDMLKVVALHDLLEHTNCTMQIIQAQFRGEISAHVEWLTIPCKLAGDTSIECKQEYFRVLESAPEAVKLLRLADRVSTAQHLLTFAPRSKKQRYMQETRMFHMPLATPYPFFRNWFQNWQIEHKD